MKKILLGISIIACLGTFTSCFNDDDNEASASIQYYATCESIDFTDENDTTFTKLINESLDILKLAGNGSIFPQKASVNNGYMGTAIFECNRLATEKYNKLVQQADIDDIKKIIYDNHRDSLGLTSPNDIPLDAFTTSLALRTLYTINADTIKTFKKTFR